MGNHDRDTREERIAEHEAEKKAIIAFLQSQDFKRFCKLEEKFKEMLEFEQLNEKFKNVLRQNNGHFHDMTKLIEEAKQPT